MNYCENLLIFCLPLPLLRAQMTYFNRLLFTKMGSTLLHLTDDNSATEQARESIFLLLKSKQYFLKDEVNH